MQRRSDAKRSAVLPAIALTIWLSWAVSAHAGVGLAVTACLTDREIPAAVKAAIDQAALSAFQNLAGGKGRDVYQALADQAKKEVDQRQVDQMVKAVDLMSPYGQIRVQHSHYVTRRGLGAPLPFVIGCGSGLNDPDFVWISARPLPQQAFVEVRANSRNNEWSTFVWLTLEQGSWKILGLHTDAITAAGKNALELEELARKQAAKKQTWNAALLIMTAEGLSGRGPFIEPKWKKDLDRVAKGFTIPPEFQSSGVVTWNLIGRSYPVQHTTVIGIGHDLTVVIDRRLSSWPGDSEVDRDNRAFLNDLLKAHPELLDGFASITARAFSPDGAQGYGTVYEAGRGFLEQKSTPSH